MATIFTLMVMVFGVVLVVASFVDAARNPEKLGEMVTTAVLITLLGNKRKKK